MNVQEIEPPLPKAQAVGMQPLICALCHQPDHEISVVGCEPAHSIKPEIRYIDRGDDKPFARRYIAKGWKVVMFQGRLAVERMICVDCLNTDSLRDMVAQDMRDCQKRAQKKEGTADDFYLTLCEQE
jgi:hypothetical protein